MRSNDVANTFEIDQYVGIYYEIIMHDYTQRACPTAACMTSNKTFNSSYNAIENHFIMFCNNESNPFIFEYNVTNIKGYFVGIVHGGGGLNGDIFPDTVVAKGNVITNNQTMHNQYEWVIEFQCKEKTEKGETFVEFIGINFYCAYNHPSKSLINTMLDAAYDQGLGVYLNRSMAYVDQNNCTYPW